MEKQKMILKQSIGYWLNKLRSCVHQSFETRLTKQGLSVASWSVLVSVYDRSADSVNTLAEYIEIDKATISRTVDKLVLKGLLEHVSGKDRRSGKIIMTLPGTELVLLLIEEAKQNDNTFFSLLSDEQLTRLKEIFCLVFSNSSRPKLEGWLRNDCPKLQEKDMENIKHILKEATTNQWPYPKTFQALKEAGLKHYEVQFGGKYHAAFENSSGVFEEKYLDGYAPAKVAEKLCTKKLKKAIAKHISERTHYVEFLADAAKAGASHYKVDMGKRTVTYFSPDETACYEEYVPVNAYGC